MKRIILVLAFLSVLTPALVYAHGGGCRKDCPAGMCCHMEHKTGIVHCH